METYRIGAEICFHEVHFLGKRSYRSLHECASCCHEFSAISAALLDSEPTGMSVCTSSLRTFSRAGKALALAQLIEDVIEVKPDLYCAKTNADKQQTSALWTRNRKTRDQNNANRSLGISENRHTVDQRFSQPRKRDCRCVDHTGARKSETAITAREPSAQSEFPTSASQATRLARADTETPRR